MLFQPFAQGSGRYGLLVPANCGTPGGGSGGGSPRMLSRIHLPRFTGDVLVGFEVTVSTLACVTTPPRGVPANETRRNFGPFTPLIP
jgi:hypothetical protein